MTHNLENAELAKPGDGWTHGEWDFPICGCGHHIDKHEDELPYPSHETPTPCLVEGCACPSYWPEEDEGADLTVTHSDLPDGSAT